MVGGFVFCGIYITGACIVGIALATAFKHGLNGLAGPRVDLALFGRLRGVLVGNPLALCSHELFLWANSRFLLRIEALLRA